MADFLLVARNGLKAVEDGGASEVYIELGELSVVAVTAPLTLDSAYVGKVLTNEGGAGGADTRAITLPTAAAGKVFQFYNQNANNLRIVAGAGDTIRIGATVSKAGGYVESQWAGQMLKLIAINATEWVAEATPDTWTVEDA
jgi:hypothetical protein